MCGLNVNIVLESAKHYSQYGNMGIWKYGNMGLNSPKLCYPMHRDVIQLIKEFLGRALTFGAASRCVLILTKKKWAKIARYSKKFYSAGSLPAAQKFSFGPILNKKVFGGVWDGAQSCPK